MCKRSTLLLWIVASVLANAFLPSAGLAQGQAASPEFVVYCYDETRDMVSRVLSSECAGKVISPSEAEEIDQHRLHKLSHMLEGDNTATTEALHVVSLGTAFYIDPAGILLTNYHVVRNCKAMQLRDSEGKQEAATVLASDIADDLALLHAAAPSFPVARLSAETSVAPSSTIFIVGYPDQGLPPLQPLVSTGTLLRAGKNIAEDPMVFHAEVRHGNSGGPIINVEGTVIGIVKAKVNSVGVYKTSGQEIDNVGVGVPLQVILTFLRSHDVHYLSYQLDMGLTTNEKMTAPPAFVTRAECLR